MNRRNQNKVGRYRQARSDMLVKTIQKRYGVVLNSRSDAQLHTVLKRYGAASLSQLLRKVRG